MTKKEIKELKVGVSVMHKRYGECVVKDILNVGIVLTPKTAKGRTIILTDYGKDAMHWLLDNGSINTTHEDIDKHK